MNLFDSTLAGAFVNALDAAAKSDQVARERGSEPNPKARVLQRLSQARINLNSRMFAPLRHFVVSTH